MGLADRKVYEKRNGAYSLIRRDTAHEVPITLGGWKRSQSLDKQDHFKTRIYTRNSKSGLSKVPRMVVYVDLDNNRKTVLTNLRREKPDKANSKRCNRKNCRYRY